MADELNRILKGARADEPEAEPKDPEALTIADMNGSTALRPANKLLTRLHVIDKAGKVRSFQFHHLDSGSSFDGDSFTLVFVGAKHWEVKVKGHGKDLFRIYDYCTLHRWPYLREAPRDFGGDKDTTVLSEITVKDVTPKPE